MKVMLGLLTILLLLLAGGLFIYGDVERTDRFVNEYENTAAEKRAAVADDFRQSFHIDKWSIASGLCVCAAVVSGVACFKLTDKSYKTN
jgi:hypothetical protein